MKLVILGVLTWVLNLLGALLTIASTYYTLSPFIDLLFCTQVKRRKLKKTFEEAANSDKVFFISGVRKSTAEHLFGEFFLLKDSDFLSLKIHPSLMNGLEGFHLNKSYCSAKGLEWLKECNKLKVLCLASPFYDDDLLAILSQIQSLKDIEIEGEFSQEGLQKVIDANTNLDSLLITSPNIVSILPKLKARYSLSTIGTRSSEAYGYTFFDKIQLKKMLDVTEVDEQFFQERWLDLNLELYGDPELLESFQ